jgi:hypothetical protein
MDYKNILMSDFIDATDSEWELSQCPTISDVDTEDELLTCEPESQKHETWKVLATYSDYLISDMGNIKHRWLLNDIKIKKDKNGYEFCYLIDDFGQQNHEYIHRLVAKLFCMSTKKHWSQIQVNHINKKRSDNRSDNLEWLSPKQNAFHRDHFKTLYPSESESSELD